jgi:hypothetical protein
MTPSLVAALRDPARLAALRCRDLQQSMAEPAFDRLTDLAWLLPPEYYAE